MREVRCREAARVPCPGDAPRWKGGTHRVCQPPAQPVMGWGEAPVPTGTLMPSCDSSCHSLPGISLTILL